MNEGGEVQGLGGIVRRESARLLSAKQFHELSEVPAAVEWLANIDNPNTRRAYQSDLEAFTAFCGIEVSLTICVW